MKARLWDIRFGGYDSITVNAKDISTALEKGLAYHKKELSIYRN